MILDVRTAPSGEVVASPREEAQKKIEVDDICVKAELLAYSSQPAFSKLSLP